MPVNTVEFRELGMLFIFQSGSPYAIRIAGEINKLRIENKQLREANEVFGKRQEWRTELIIELEDAIAAEREACARKVQDLVDQRVPASEYPDLIRRGGA